MTSEGMAGAGIKFGLSEGGRQIVERWIGA